MLRRWDDSQKYLSDNPHLVCEETANYLVIWCIDLEVEEVRSQAEIGVKNPKIPSFPSWSCLVFTSLDFSPFFLPKKKKGLRNYKAGEVGKDP